jgi:outer membrane biosynthesis protein TonB
VDYLEIRKLLETVEANAQFKGLNTSDLKIVHISANNAGNVWRYGRFRRRKMKRTDIEVVEEESKNKPKNKEAVKPQKIGEKKDNQKKAEEKPKTEKKETAVKEEKKPVKKEDTKPVEKKEDKVPKEVKQ